MSTIPNMYEWEASEGALASLAWTSHIQMPFLKSYSLAGEKNVQGNWLTQNWVEHFKMELKESSVFCH